MRRLVVRFNEIQDLSNDELFGYTNLVREIARFLWRENTPSNKCIYPENISKYLRNNSRLDKLWHAQSPNTQEFMADQIYAAMYQMELDSFTESQDNNNDDMFGASIATLPKVESILAAGIPLYITNVVANDKDRRCRVKEIRHEVRTFGQMKPFISFWLDDAQTSGSILPWNDREWQLQRIEDGFVLWPRDKKLQETHSDDDDVFAERSVSQKVMNLVQTGQPVYYAVDVGKPRDQWRLREIIRATPTNYTWLNRSGMTITLGYDSIPVKLQKLDNGKNILVPSTRNVDESDTSDNELFGPRAVTRINLQQMIDNDIPVYLRIKSNGEDAQITEINPPMEGYPGYWMRYRSPTQRGMLAWRDRHWAVESYRDGVILQPLPGARMYESESDQDLFGTDDLRSRLHARIHAAWKKITYTLDELGPEAIFQSAKMFSNLYYKWDDGEHDPMAVMAFRESPDKVLQAVAELEKIAKDPYDYLEHLSENNDDDMFSRPGRLAKVINTELTTLRDPYVRTVEIVRDLAKNKFKVKTRVSAKSPRATRGQATFWFGEYATKPGEDSPKTPPVALQIKAELESQGFECKFTDSGWLSVKVPPMFSNVLGEDDDNELFGGRKLTPGYLKELVNTTGLWLEISGGEQFRVLGVGRFSEFPDEIAFKMSTSYGEGFTASYPPDMLRLDLTHQGTPVLHYGTLAEASDDDMFSSQSKIQTLHLTRIFRAVEDLVTLTIVNVYPPEDPRDDTINELNKFMTRHNVSFKIVELALQRIASFDSFDEFYNEMLHIYKQHYKDELGEVKEPESDEELFTPEKTLITRGHAVANVLRKISFDTMSEVMKIRPQDMESIREKIYLATLNYERGDILEGNAQIYTLTPRAFSYITWSLEQAGLNSYARRISEQRDQYQQDDMFADQSRLTQNRFIGKIIIKLAEEIYNDPLSEQSDKEDAKDLQTVGRVFSTQGTRQGLTLIRQWADNGDTVIYDNVLSVMWQHGIDIGELEQQYQI